MKLTNDEFRRIVHFMRSHFGINLEMKRTLIEGRLENTLISRGFQDYHTYLNAVVSDKTGQELTKLLDILTTNHTYFMRETDHFNFFETVVLPYLESQIKDHDLRVWSAGCSTGQEPYTLVMLIKRHFGERAGEWDIKVLATDISSKVLNKAVAGVYDVEETHLIPPDFKVNYFEIGRDGTARVVKQIKDEVIFRPFNLMDRNFPFRKRFHAIFCRNVMIYFNEATKNDLIHKFYDALEPGGYLFIGQSESIDRRTNPFEYVMPSIYRKV